MYENAYPLVCVDKCYSNYKARITGCRFRLGNGARVLQRYSKQASAVSRKDWKMMGSDIRSIPQVLMLLNF